MFTSAARNFFFNKEVQIHICGEELDEEILNTENEEITVFERLIHVYINRVHLER